MSIGFSYGLAGPKRKKTCGKILLSSVIFANKGVCFPLSPRVTGACEMTGGALSSARAAAQKTRTAAAAPTIIARSGPQSSRLVGICTMIQAVHAHHHRRKTAQFHAVRA